MRPRLGSPKLGEDTGDDGAAAIAPLPMATDNFADGDRKRNTSPCRASPGGPRRRGSAHDVADSQLRENRRARKSRRVDDLEEKNSGISSRTRARDNMRRNPRRQGSHRMGRHICLRMCYRRRSLPRIPIRIPLHFFGEIKSKALRERRSDVGRPRKMEKSFSRGQRMVRGKLHLPLLAHVMNEIEARGAGTGEAARQRVFNRGAVG